MAYSISTSILKLFFLASLLQAAMAARKLTGEDDDSQSTQLFKYHDGALLSGKISLNLIWYGNFKPSQKAIITDFIASLASPPPPPPSSQPQAAQPSVAAWWKQIDKYYRLSTSKKTSRPLSLSLGAQVSDQGYSLGKRLTDEQITLLASKGQLKDAINIVLTASDVVVAGQCMSRCGSHGSGTGHAPGSKRLSKFAYIWVGNSETQCPGQCAWPFHQPIYGPQSPPLVAPNNDIGLDGMVINVASLLAGTVTNPFKNGFFQGPQDAPLEAASACPGVYGSGAYPGYAGNLLVDSTTGASYNANGVNGRKYLLPALFDPATSSCSTLV